MMYSQQQEQLKAANFLVEILTEDIPPSCIHQATALKHFLNEQFKECLGQPLKSLEVDISVRRVVFWGYLDLSQGDTLEEIRGPKVGAPAHAVEGFAQKIGVDPSELQEKITTKGTYWVYEKVRINHSPEYLFSTVLEKALHDFSWRKQMSWGEYSFLWPRPIRSLFVLYEKRVLEGAVLSRYSAPTQTTVVDLSLQQLPQSFSQECQDKLKSKPHLLWAKGAYTHPRAQTSYFIPKSPFDYYTFLFETYGIILDPHVRRQALRKVLLQLTLDISQLSLTSRVSLYTSTYQDLEGVEEELEALCSESETGALIGPSGYLYPTSGQDIRDFDQTSLFSTFCSLIEIPAVQVVSYDKKFVTLPESFIAATFEDHQKSFIWVGENHRLKEQALYFITTVDQPIYGYSTQSVDRKTEKNLGTTLNSEVSQIGFKRVSQARLDDTLFFFQKDLQLSQAQLEEKLQDKVYHNKIGSYLDVQRSLIDSVAQLEQACLDYSREKTIPLYGKNIFHSDSSEILEIHVIPTQFFELLRFFAEVVFWDGGTQVVGEYPDLSGLVMYEILKRQEEWFPAHWTKEQAQTVLETLAHLNSDIRPKIAQWEPQVRQEALLFHSIAMQLFYTHRVVLHWLAGLKPKGSGDPFALRRDLLAMLELGRILAEEKVYWDYPYELFIEAVYSSLAWNSLELIKAMPLETLKQEIAEALAGRLRAQDKDVWGSSSTYLVLKEHLKRFEKYSFSLVYLFLAEKEQREYIALVTVSHPEFSAVQKRVEGFSEHMVLLDSLDLDAALLSASSSSTVALHYECQAFCNLLQSVDEMNEFLSPESWKEQLFPRVKRLYKAMSHFFEQEMVLNQNEAIRMQNLGLLKKAEALLQEFHLRCYPYSNVALSKAEQPEKNSSKLKQS